MKQGIFMKLNKKYLKNKVNETNNSRKHENILILANQIYA